MKNRLMQLAAGLALMAVLGKFYAVPLIAQVRAALVKNIDERGRIPYMVQAHCASGQGVLTNQCAGSFPAVPGNKRFVVEYINGEIDADHNRPFSRAFLELPSPNQGSLILSTHFESLIGQTNFDTYSVSMPVVFYCEAGQIAVIHLFAAQLGNSPVGGDFILSGYLVDLTQ
jgi:hypothetical protein